MVTSDLNFDYFKPPIVKACFQGDANELQNLINQGHDVNYQVYITFIVLCDLYRSYFSPTLLENLKQ